MAKPMHPKMHARARLRCQIFSSSLYGNTQSSDVRNASLTERQGPSRLGNLRLRPRPQERESERGGPLAIRLPKTAVPPTPDTGLQPQLPCRMDVHIDKLSIPPEATDALPLLKHRLGSSLAAVY